MWFVGVMFTTSAYRPGFPRALRAAVLALAVAGTAACAPLTNEPNACRGAAVSLTGFKDEDAVGRFGGEIDTAMQTVMASSSPPSCALVVVAQNRISTINRYGQPFDVGGNLFVQQLPDVAQTRLYVGSISKTITALAMMKLAELEADPGGIVGTPPVSLLDRRLADLYPPVGSEEPQWAGFTPRQYLAHATGAANWPNPMEDSALGSLPASAGPNPGIHPRHAFVVYRNTDPARVPFTASFDAVYSNIGYSMVGAAIDWQVVDDRAGSEPGYEKFVYENVALDENTTSPPSMLSLCLGTPWRAPNMANLARGFTAASNAPAGAPNFSGWEGPAGGWTMTIGDLGRLIIAINTNARVSQGMTDQMMANVATGPVSNPADWGLGVWRTRIGAGEVRYGKGGDITGFTSDFMAYRDAGVGAGIVCNQGSMSHGVLRTALRAIIDPCRQSAPPAYCSPPE